MRRFLLHVLPKGIKCLRHYGVLASACKGLKLGAARQALQMPVLQDRKVVGERGADRGWPVERARLRGHATKSGASVMPVLNESKSAASTLKPVLTGKIGANPDALGRSNEEKYLTACLAGCFL